MDSPRPTPYFDRLCIFVLAFEWTVFGSMHFSFHDITVRMVPNFIPEDLKSMVAVITGMIEVTIGILFLVPSARKWAALTSLVLLALYIPAVYKILADDTVLGIGPGAALFRLVLIPNNIFLALCSLHLWRYPNLQATETAQLVEESLAPRTPMKSSAGSARATLLVAFILFAANCAGFLVIGASPIQDRMTAYLWAMMCLATGAFVGFLFAVPRFNPDEAQKRSLLPNANIEAVSDWLTKIIVGVGLVNLGAIGEFLSTTSQTLADAITGQRAFAEALILYFFVDGLIQGYLLTRMFLGRQFSLVDPTK